MRQYLGWNPEGGMEGSDGYAYLVWDIDNEVYIDDVLWADEETGEYCVLRWEPIKAIGSPEAWVRCEDLFVGNIRLLRVEG